jgi:hypothetical protein
MWNSGRLSWFTHFSSLTDFILQQIPKSGVYNRDMARKIRFVLAILILALSFALLVWGLWPDPEETRILPVDPSQMQLPTPVSYYMETIG